MRKFPMKELLKTWFPMIKPALLTVALLDVRHVRCALMLMRLRQEFGLVEVEGGEVTKP
jgi:hypothetical protein